MCFLQVAENPPTGSWWQVYLWRVSSLYSGHVAGGGGTWPCRMLAGLADTSSPYTCTPSCGHCDCTTQIASCRLLGCVLIGLENCCGELQASTDLQTQLLDGLKVRRDESSWTAPCMYACQCHIP